MPKKKTTRTEAEPYAITELYKKEMRKQKKKRRASCEKAALLKDVSSWSFSLSLIFFILC